MAIKDYLGLSRRDRVLISIVSMSLITLNTYVAANAATQGIPAWVTFVLGGAAALAVLLREGLGYMEPVKTGAPVK